MWGPGDEYAHGPYHGGVTWKWWWSYCRCCTEHQHPELKRYRGNARGNMYVKTWKWLQAVHMSYHATCRATWNGRSCTHKGIIRLWALLWVLKRYLPWHVLLSNPKFNSASGHSHLYPPAVLTHLWLQPPFDIVHSLISKRAVFCVIVKL